MKSRSGFTLIELSIVLVIIGLLAGGVLVGRDLIRAAEVRAQVSQIEKYNAAISTFRTKYDGFPGDLLASKANAFGFTVRGGPGSGDGGGLGHGDDNRELDMCGGHNMPDGGQTNASVVGCEHVLFWSDLSMANLIDGSFTSATDGYITALNREALLLYFPAAKIGGSGIIFTDRQRNGKNWFILANLDSVASGFPTATSWPISASAAYAIDSKMDDGTANSGIAQAHALGVAGGGYFFANPPPQCASGAGQYNLSNGTERPACNLNMRVTGLN